MKTCSKCLIEKSLDSFYRMRASKSGYGPWCKRCMNECSEYRRKADPEKARKQRREWELNNPEKVREITARKRGKPAYKERMSAYAKRWYAENKERLKAIRRAWYVKNKPEHNARSLSQYYEDPQSWRERAKAWAKANPERWREMMRNGDNKRRARKAGASGAWTEKDVQLRFALQRGKCAACRIELTRSFHRDHVVALAVGGSNDKSNLQLLCRSCNSRKHKKDNLRFMQENGYLL